MRKMTFKEWEDEIKAVTRDRWQTAWKLGALLNYGEREYGEMYAQALDHTHYEYSTVRKFKYVEARFPKGRRRNNLSWSHHAEVASLPPKEADKLLDSAEKFHWSRADLRAHLPGKDKAPPRHMLKIHADIYEAITKSGIGDPCEGWARRVVADARMLDGILAGQLEVLGLDRSTNAPRCVKREEAA